MGIWSYCPKCKENQKFVFYDGGLSSNPKFVCVECGFESEDIEEVKNDI